eukprot:gene3886-7758_t
MPQATFSMSELDLTIDTSAGNRFLFDSIKTVVREIVPDYRGSPDEDFNIIEMHGGITNLLFLVSSKSINIKSVIVRIFGTGMSAVIDRKIENKICVELANRDLAPAVFGVFSNGRVEEYIDSDTLVPEDLLNDKISSSLAIAIADLHEKDISLDCDRTPVQFKKLMTLYELANGIIFDDVYKNDKARSFDFPKLFEDLQWLCNECTSHYDTTHLCDAEAAGREFGEQIVICHNDLLAGGYAITIIDFEYSGYNPRALDLANHFCEYGGFSCDYHNKFPSSVKRASFLSIYTSHLLSHSSYDQNSSNSNNTEHSNGMADSSTTNADYERFQHLFESDHESFIRGFDCVVCKYVPTSHLFWFFWAILQAKHSAIDFDFLGYAELRLKGYYLHKSWVSANAAG